MTLDEAIDRTVRILLSEGVPPAMLAGALFGAGVALLREVGEKDDTILKLVATETQRKSTPKT